MPAVSVGSTPAMSAVESLEGVTEARPGNYVFFDFIQVALGSCAVRDCGVTVLASVVSSRAGQSVVDAGALALSKDTGPSGSETMGEIFADYETGVLDPEGGWSRCPRSTESSTRACRSDRACGSCPIIPV